MKGFPRWNTGGCSRKEENKASLLGIRACTDTWLSPKETRKAFPMGGRKRCDCNQELPENFFPLYIMSFLFVLRCLLNFRTTSLH
jgi:hypothetical protein